MRRPDLRLIVITDRSMAAPRELLTVVRQSLQGGAPAIQLRDKHAHARALLEQADAMRALTDEFGALLFINDRLDVALAAHADGVHLGPDDIPLHAARSAVPADFLIGISTDDPAEARTAQLAGADYIGCGAVFGTTSKADLAGEALGVVRLAEVVNAVEIPVVGIGGIDSSNVAEIAAAGAAGAAVIGAVMKAQEPEAAVHALLQPFIVRA